MRFTEWIRRLKAAEPWLEEGYSYKGVSWKGTVPFDEVKTQIDARLDSESLKYLKIGEALQQGIEAGIKGDSE